MLNLCWRFFATSHGKSVCDGIGGMVNRLSANASLQRPASDQILNVHDMLNFCKGAIEDIKYYLVTKERMFVVQKELANRFATGRTIPGTRSFHLFLPDNSNCIQVKRISEDQEFAGEFSFCEQTPLASYFPKRQEFVASIYNNLWWTGIVIEINTEEQDCKVNFLYPPSPTRNFHLPRQMDSCWVPIPDIISPINVPQTMTGRIYNIPDNDLERIVSKF